MSSFTSKTVRDLYEAYNSVYIDETELFLNNLLNTVTDNINQLVNEGYDLSDYSWEEIYVSFLENVLEPELQEVESFITQLNESSEELTEEQIENLLQERLGSLLSGLGGLLKGRQAIQTATQAVTRAPKPSIIQAPPVKLGTPSTAPSTNPLYAPGVSSGKPVKPSITPPSGVNKGSFGRFGDWINSFTSKGRAQQAAKPPAGTPKPAGYQPTNLRGIDLRPAADVIRKTSGALKAATYDKLPKNVRRVIKGTAVTTLASPLLGVAGRDVYRAATGGPSVTQTALARAQQAYGVGEIGVGKLQGIVDPVGGQETVQSGQANVRAGSQSIADVKRKERERNRQGRTGQTDSLTGLPIYQHYEIDLNDRESINEVLVKGKDGKWYDAKFDKNGKKISQVEVAPKPEAIDRYNRLKAQQTPPAPAKPKPKPEPAKPAPTPANQPAQAPEASRPAPAKPAPAPARQPAPQASPVAKYMAAAAAARKTGDPAEMAKVRDMGMEIWRKSNPKLAAAADERARIRGTAQTDNPLMKDMRSRLPLTPSVQSPEVKNLGSGQQSLSQNPNAAIAATPKPKPTPQQITTAYKTPQQVTPAQPTGAPNMSTQATKITPKTDQYKKDAKPLLKQSYEYDSYDLVLEYLISEGYVDTQSEAEFLMSYMDAECIHNIVEQNEFITEKIGSLLKLLPKKNLVLGKVLKKLGLPVAAGAATVAVMRPDLTKKVIDNIKGTTQNAKQSAIDNLDKLRNMMPDLSTDDKDKDKDKDKGKEEPSTSGGMSPLASPPPEVVSPARIARQYNRIRSDEIRTGDTSSTSSRYLSRELSRLQKNNEAYDVVLDYLLSEGHADTIEEANYVMLQMDAEHIQNIVNG